MSRPLYIDSGERKEKISKNVVKNVFFSIFNIIYDKINKYCILSLYFLERMKLFYHILMIEP